MYNLLPACVATWSCVRKQKRQLEQMHFIALIIAMGPHPQRHIAFELFRAHRTLEGASAVQISHVRIQADTVRESFAAKLARRHIRGVSLHMLSQTVFVRQPI